jgi:hypothetical protein
MLDAENPVGMADVVTVDFNPRKHNARFSIEFRRNDTYKRRLNVSFLRNSKKVG